MPRHVFCDFLESGNTKRYKNNISTKMNTIITVSRESKGERLLKPQTTGNADYECPGQA